MLKSLSLITAAVMVISFSAWLDMVLLRGITSLLNASSDIEVLVGIAFMVSTIVVNIFSIVIVKKTIQELKS
jgi:hypothetical protein